MERGINYMVNILDDVQKDCYHTLIKLLLEQSDEILFHLPNMDKIIVNERNVDLMPGYPIGYVEELEQTNFQNYYKRVKPYIELISNDITSRYFDTGYLDQRSNREIEVFRVKTSADTIKFFASANDLAQWRYPFLPADPCFLQDEKCIFKCISHEKIYSYYGTDKRIVKLLRKHRLKYMTIPDKYLK